MITENENGPLPKVSDPSYDIFLPQLYFMRITNEKNLHL